MVIPFIDQIPWTASFPTWQMKWCSFWLLHYDYSSSILFFPTKFYWFHLCDLGVQFDARISTASALVQKLLASASNDVIRCPYLANLEIERRKFLFGKGDDEKLVEALMQYYCRYSATLNLFRRIISFAAYQGEKSSSLFVFLLLASWTPWLSFFNSIDICS